MSTANRWVCLAFPSCLGPLADLPFFPLQHVSMQLLSAQRRPVVGLERVTPAAGFLFNVPFPHRLYGNPAVQMYDSTKCCQAVLINHVMSR